MDYDSLSLTYWQEQIARIVEARRRIAERTSWVEEGRIVPGDEDLIIGTGRRLDMAVMFLDLCGFSTRPSGNLQEQELLLRALNLFFTEMIKIAEDYGGVVEKNTGDGLMAYFNDNEGNPPADGCKRAVAAAMTMFHTNGQLISPIMRNSQLEDFRFRIGIDYGSVTIAQIGAARRFGSLVAVGNTANIACKMLRVAGPNEIVIGENVQRQLPIFWQIQWCRLRLPNTGWIYRSTGNPYRFFTYFGRWILPQGNSR
jgi:class 3 adenylate cyclase